MTLDVIHQDFSLSRTPLWDSVIWDLRTDPTCLQAKKMFADLVTDPYYPVQTLPAWYWNDASADQSPPAIQAVVVGVASPSAPLLATPLALEAGQGSA